MLEFEISFKASTLNSSYCFQTFIHFMAKRFALQSQRTIRFNVVPMITGFGINSRRANRRLFKCLNIIPQLCTIFKYILYKTFACFGQDFCACCINRIYLSAEIGSKCIYNDISIKVEFIPGGQDKLDNCTVILCFY